MTKVGIEMENITGDAEERLSISDPAELSICKSI